MNHQPNTPASLNETVAWQMRVYDARHGWQAWQDIHKDTFDIPRDHWVSDPKPPEFRALCVAAPGAAIDAREQSAARWDMLPAFLEKHQIDYVALVRDIDAQIASRQEAPAKQEGGYANAFYELGKLMGIPAQPISPERVWREQMLPTLQKALAVRIASRDTALLDFMQRHRVAVIPEFEGPWDAEIYGEDEAPNARGSGNTPREAIDAARAALASQPGGAVEGKALSPATVAQPVNERVVMLPKIGAVPASRANGPGILALERMASSIKIIGKIACWDHSAMFAVRDALCDAPEQPALAMKQIPPGYAETVDKAARVEAHNAFLDEVAPPLAERIYAAVCAHQNNPYPQRGNASGAFEEAVAAYDRADKYDRAGVEIVSRLIEAEAKKFAS